MSDCDNGRAGCATTEPVDGIPRIGLLALNDVEGKTMGVGKTLPRMIGRGRAILLVVIPTSVCAILLLAGCGGGSSGAGTASAPAGASEAAGSKKVDLEEGGILRFGMPVEASTLDPADVLEQVSPDPAAITESLYIVEPDGSVKPNLVTSGVQSRDGLTWTFALRSGVTFSTGKPMTMRDVIFSLNHVRKGLNGASFEDIRSVGSSGGKLIVKLAKPFPGLPSVLSVGGIIPDDFDGMTEKEFSQHPVGTGPFEFSSWRHGQAITVVRNEHYWGEAKPFLEGIEFIPVPDEASGLSQMRAHQLDGMSANPLGIKTGAPAGSGIRVEETDQVLVNYLLLNQNVPAFQNPKVREAINLAIDREGILATATAGLGQGGASILAPASEFSLALQPPVRDVEKARDLVAEAAKEGAATSFAINYFGSDGYSQLAAQILQQDFEEAGLKVRLRPLEPVAVGEKEESGEFEAVVAYYAQTTPDPASISQVILPFFFKNSAPNFTTLNRLGAEAAVARDPEKRQALYTKLQETIASENGMIVLNYQPEVFPVLENVSGVEVTAFGELRFGKAGFTG